MRTAKLLFIVLLVGPLVFYGKAEAASPPTDRADANHPPVEQALVPEGVFAVQLVEALNMGQAQDEAQAENMLSSVGIEPKNGWIAGYPVTPPIMDEIEKGVISAADAGKLRMGKDQALNALEGLKVKLGLNVTAGANFQSGAPKPSSGSEAGNTVIYKYIDKGGVIHFTDRYESIPEEYQAGVEMIRGPVRPQLSLGPAEESTQTHENTYTPNQTPEVINNYYYSYGPPVVTYYAPPAPYGYLYAWVPYPFWCSRLFFHGFFILHDFHRRVFFHGRPLVVTNHVVVKKRVLIVDPASRTLRRGTGPNRVNSQRAFHSPGVQSSARTIVGLTQKKTAPKTAPMPARLTNAAPSLSNGRLQGSNRPNQGVANQSARRPGNTFQAPRISEGRTINPPAASGRFSNSTPPRVSSPPAAASGRFFNSVPPQVSNPPPASRSRIFGAPAPSGRGYSGGFFRGEVFRGHGRTLGGGARAPR